MAKSKPKQVTIPEIKIGMLKVKIKGESPMIFNQFSQKAKQQILDKQMKKAKQAKKARDPEAEYQASYYRNKKGEIALPAHNIKQSMVGAARFIDGAKMTQVRGALFVVGDDQGFIKVDYKDERMREDMVRLQGIGRPADLRFRGEVSGWSMTFWIKYNANLFSIDQVINLLKMAGFSQGLGEWRPEKGGMYGTFDVVEGSEAQ